MREAYVHMMSNKSHRQYIGVTTDLVMRARQHKDGCYRNAFTARYKFDRYRAALKRERYLKGLLRSRKVELIQQKNPKWIDFSTPFDDLMMLSR